MKKPTNATRLKLKHETMKTMRTLEAGEVVEVVGGGTVLSSYTLNCTV